MPTIVSFSSIFILPQDFKESLALLSNPEEGYDWLKGINFQKQHMMLIQEHVLLL